MKIVFLAPVKAPLDIISSWSPHEEPSRYPDAIGHGFYQLFLAVRDILGSENVWLSSFPKGCDLVLSFERIEYTLAQNYHLFYQVMLKPSLRFISIISDTPKNRLSIFYKNSIIYPNKFYKKSKLDVDLPLLPQNGLICPHVQMKKCLGVVCTTKYAPSFLKDARFIAELERIGFTLTVRFVDEPFSSPAYWDYSEIGFMLCIRQGGDPSLRKPPTKVVNCWSAGVIPIIESDPVSLSIARPPLDCLLLNTDWTSSPQEAIGEIIDLLVKYSDKAQSVNLLQNVQKQMSKYSHRSITYMYLNQFKNVMDSKITATRLTFFFNILWYTVRKLLYRRRYRYGIPSYHLKR